MTPPKNNNNKTTTNKQNLFLYQFLVPTLLLVAKVTTVKWRNFFIWTADNSGKFAFSAENKTTDNKKKIYISINIDSLEN